MEKEIKSKAQGPKHHGHAIKRLRRDIGMSQEQLSKLLGISQSTIVRHEEEEVLSEELLQQYAKSLGVSVDFIKKMEDDKSLVEYIQNNNTYTYSGNTLNNIGEGTVNNLDILSLEKVLDRFETLCKKNMEQCSEMIKGYVQLVKAYKGEEQESGEKEEE